jgi:hypothetical protein
MHPGRRRADFLSGMISGLPPLQELARNAGLDLPTYLGQLQREAERSQAPVKSAGSNEPAPPKPKRESGQKSRSPDLTAGLPDKNGLPAALFAGLMLG